MSAHDVAIVGAGPYGLSIAAHLRAQDARFRIFGSPMQTWREHMPKGMLLKSDGFASNLSDPAGSFTLGKFCADHGIPYDDTKVPVGLETFTAYGQAFQRAMVPELEERQVITVEPAANGFRVRLNDGERTIARNVVLAVGITHFAFVPPEFAGLSRELVSHSSAHQDPRKFRGRKVTVLGAGASAIDLAVLLHDSGAQVSLIARTPALKFHDPPAESPSLWQRLRRPKTPIGPGLRSRMFTEFPGLFRYLPADLRLRIIRRHLGPAAGWPMRERMKGNVETLLGCTVQKAEIDDGGVRLELAGPTGTTEHRTEHVIAATGYRVDVDRLKFLSDELRGQIRQLDRSPALTPSFESTVPGLYFVGLASATTFGPMMRFACGADYTAHSISRHLMRSAARSSASARAVAACG